MRNTIAKQIEQKARENKDFVLISGDAGLGVWDSYKQTYPKQYINPGINEALCVGLAAGLSLVGKRVVYYNIAPFVIMRPYEQVRNDICYQELNVILIGTGSGLTYMPSGMTHYAIEDIGLGLSLPNLDIFSPCCPNEARECFEYAYKSSKPSYIRIPKAGEPLINNNEHIDVAFPQILHLGTKKTALISHSQIVKDVLEIGKKLDMSVFSMPLINSTKLDCFKPYERLIVVEEHYRFGGLGTYLTQMLERQVEILALSNAFVHLIANQAKAREKFGLDLDSIEKFILNGGKK